MNTERRPRGTTLIETMAALAILAVIMTGLASGMVAATNATGISANRTQMNEFAQARLERLATQTRTRICTAATTVPVDCSLMSTGGQAFMPTASTAAPGTSGWLLDVLEGPPGVSGGDDVMAGPVVVLSGANGVDVTQTLNLRTQLLADWAGGDHTGCGSVRVTKSPAVLCREVHTETLVTGNPAVPQLVSWVRVLRGGAPIGNAIIQQVTLAQ